MAEDEDYDGGDMDDDDFIDDEPMDDIELEPAENDDERIQLIEVFYTYLVFFV